MYTNGAQIKDFIYAMPYDAVTAQGMTYARFRTWRRGQNDNGFYSIEMTNSVGGNMTLTLNLLNYSACQEMTVIQ